RCFRIRDFADGHPVDRLPLLAFTSAMLPSGFLAQVLPPSVDGCWLGFWFHSSPGRFRLFSSLLFSSLLPFCFSGFSRQQGRKSSSSWMFCCVSSLRLMAYWPLLLVRAFGHRFRLGPSIAPPFGFRSADVMTYYALC